MNFTKTTMFIARYIFFLATFTFFVESSIKHIVSLNDVQSILEQADADTLVLFDVDDTLITPCDSIFHQKNAQQEQAYESLITTLKQKAKDKFDDLWSKTCLTERMLIEPHVVDVIQNLQKKGVKVMALTLIEVGAYGVITSLEKLRFKQLKRFNIDFQHSFNQTLVFKEYEPKRGTYPVLYKGILFTNGYAKGDIVVSMLDGLHYRPKRVIFFDDLLNNVISVEKAMLKQNIDFYGYHYTAAQNIPIEFDYYKAQAQLDYLYIHGSWLSDNQLDQMSRYKVEEIAT